MQLPATHQVRIAGRGGVLAGRAPMMSQAATADPNTWTDAELILFLKTYQWLAAMTAPPMGVRGSDLTYEGKFNLSLFALGTILRITNDVLDVLSPNQIVAFEELTRNLDQGSADQQKGRAATGTYRNLRDQVVSILYDQRGYNVYYEEFGDNVETPNKLVLRRLERNTSKTVNALYSEKTLQQMVDEMLGLREKARALGEPLDEEAYELAGKKLGAAPVIGILLVIAGAAIAFYWIYHSVEQKDRLTDAAIKAIEEDPDLPADQKARALQDMANSSGALNLIFGGVPWESIIFAGAVVGLLIWGLPKLVGVFQNSAPARRRERDLETFEPPRRSPPARPPVRPEPERAVEARVVPPRPAARPGREEEEEL